MFTDSTKALTLTNPQSTCPTGRETTGVGTMTVCSPSSVAGIRITSLGPICFKNHFLYYSIVQPQSLTPYFYKTKEYSDMSLYMGGKIRL